MIEAEKDFEDMNPANVTIKSNGTKVGRLENGDSVNVRKHSSDERPTLEIQRPNQPEVKVRYGPKPTPPNY